MKYAVLSMLLAMVGTLGSLFLSLGMGLKACPLCFYQRTFMMAIAAILALGLLADRERHRLLCLLSLPLSLAGVGVAAFHEFLVVTEVLECPMALLGLGTAPAQSLAMFAVLTVAIVPGVERKARSIGIALGLGLVMAWAAIASSPPLPPAPQAPYDTAKQPLDTCRPVFRESK